MTWLTRPPPGVGVIDAPPAPFQSREAVLEHVLRSVLNERQANPGRETGEPWRAGILGDTDAGAWVPGQRRGDTGLWMGGRGFVRAPELEPWDQLWLAL